MELLYFSIGFILGIIVFVGGFVVGVLSAKRVIYERKKIAEGEKSVKDMKGKAQFFEPISPQEQVEEIFRKK